jgi:hypothetical protein
MQQTWDNPSKAVLIIVEELEVYGSLLQLLLALYA